MTELTRCRVICAVSALGAVAGMALSWRLWVAPIRDFAVVPANPWLDLAPEVTTGLLPVLLFGIVLGWHKYWGAAGLFAWLLLMGADLMRGQPWMYQYVLIACLAGGSPRACRLIMAGVYFWAGLAKLNPNFFTITGPWMTASLPCLKHIYFLLPYAEIATGLALVVPGRAGQWVGRWMGRGLVLGISIGALVCLVPLRWNTVVWPWQIANVVLVWLATAPMSLPPPVPLPGRWRGHAAAFLAVAMPSLVFVGLWPEYFSWRVYDGRQQMPDELQTKATDELNVPIPPDPWMLRWFGKD